MTQDVKMGQGKPAAIFFDWDGTLVDTYAFLEGAHQHTHLELKMPALQDGVFKQYFGQPKHYIYDSMYGEKAPQAMDIFKAYYLENHLSGMQVLAGAQALLEMIHSMDIPMGVVTNKQADYVLAEIAHLGWTPFFRSVVTAGEAEEDKPSAAPLHLSVKRAAVEAGGHDIWMVGDTENDLLCAQNAGHKSVLIAPEEVQKVLLSEYISDLHFKNCHDFCEFLLQYREK